VHLHLPDPQTGQEYPHDEHEIFRPNDTIPPTPYASAQSGAWSAPMAAAGIMGHTPPMGTPGIVGPAPGVGGAPGVNPNDLRAQRESWERTQILGALEKTSGNQKEAAKLLGISRRTLINKIEAYGIARPRKR
jgi:transcriptional regulator with AAA-type ATPase domain